MKALGLVVLVSSVGMVGCQAAQHSTSGPAGAGPNQMLNDVSVGKHRCDAAADSPTPFVVEWDATDLASFEGYASRDVVFVKFQGCELELLHGCSDTGIPGAYGRYGQPAFTSGTVEAFTMKNEDELFAKLPLGAIEFGGNVKAGEELQLRYFVSGVVSSTRDTIYRGSIEKNPRCAAATHFVSSYNLGAFRLLASKSFDASADAKVGVFGGDAKTKSDSSNLKEGGKLESCDSAAQRQCRVPIRLILRSIQGGAPPASAAPEAAQASVPVGETPAQTAHRLRREAIKKEEAGDGNGCLEDLKRAEGLEQTEQSRLETMYIGAQCRMRAGDCNGGKAELREWYRWQNKERKMTDADIENTVTAFAQRKCPAGRLAGGDQVVRLAASVDTAARSGDVAACSAQLGDLDAAHDAAVKAKDHPQAERLAQLYGVVIDCYARNNRCDLARKLWPKYYEAALAARLGAAAAGMREKLFDQMFGKHCPK